MSLRLILVRLIPSVILAQTLLFKFSGAPESIYIFNTLGVGTPGRIGSGVIELLAVILLMIPKTTYLGSLLTIATMSGAVMSHLFILGIEIQEDGGLLFSLAIVTLVFAVINLYISQFKIVKNLRGLINTGK